MWNLASPFLPLQRISLLGKINSLTYFSSLAFTQIHGTTAQLEENGTRWDVENLT